MAKRIANKALLMSAAMVVLLPIVLIPRASGQGNQNLTKLRVTVTGNKSGATQPVAGADVLVRSKTGEYEETAKTDSQGNANISDVPFGKTLIQVTAPGWNNHGQTHELNKKEQSIQVQLTSTNQENPTPTPTPTSTPTPTPTPFERAGRFRGSVKIGISLLSGSTVPAKAYQLSAKGTFAVHLVRF